MTPSDVAAATRMKVQIVDALEQEQFDQIAAPIYVKGFIKLFAECVGLDPKPLVDEYLVGGTQGSKPARSAPVPRRAEPDLKPLPKPEPEPEPDLFSQAETPPSEEEEDVLERGLPRIRSVKTITAAPPVLREPLLEEAIAPAEPAPPVPRKRIEWRPYLSALREGARKVAGVAAGIPGKLAGAVRAVSRRLRQAWGERVHALAEVRFSEAPARTVLLGVGVLVVFLFVLSGLSRCAGWPRPSAASPSAEKSGPLDLAVDPPPPYIE
ncbi:MAG: helix-turn-helix domain-containing protein [Chloroflexi bacterium]|nr:helix-turn-helix domain-containing protein [Chloroflexota bacterium]